MGKGKWGIFNMFKEMMQKDEEREEEEEEQQQQQQQQQTSTCILTRPEPTLSSGPISW